MNCSVFALLVALAAQAAAAPPIVKSPVVAVTAGQAWPIKEGDVVLKDFAFRSGESLPELRMHYTTLGAPHRNAAGVIDNAVMVLHGTGGTGQQFLRPQFADELYGPGQPLDIRKYWIILPDNIGHGKSSKPSDGLRMKFPKYDYDDMVTAQHAMLERMGVTQLRLIMGTSMGCMHAFVWGETYPDFAKALMPLACEPIEIAGLNRMWRQLAIDGIEQDPAWNGGNYAAEPMSGLRAAQNLSVRRRLGSAFLSVAISDPCRGQPVCRAKRLERAQVARRERPHLPAGLIAELQPVAEPREDQRSRDVDQFGRRLHQPAQLPDAAAGREADEKCRIPSHPGKHRDPRPRHSHLGEVLEGGP